MFTVQHVSHCGMSGLLRTYDERAEARQAAAKRLRAHRRAGYPVATLDRGMQWEILEPDGCAMVPDACGLLVLDHATFECPECGCAHETRDDARACCAEANQWDGDDEAVF